MSTQTMTTPLASPQLKLPLSLRIALRELRGGLSGFYIFLFCIVLGVSAISAISALSASMKSGLIKEGQAILGGDVELALNHRRVNSEEKAYLTSKGRTSEVAQMRAMAISNETKKNTLIGLKAVDDAFPLYGKMELESGQNLQSVLKEPLAAVVDPLLLKRLGLKLGDNVKIGNNTLKIAAQIKSEPDRLSGRPTLGPQVMISVETLKQIGLAEPGSLVRWAYRIRFPQQSEPNETLSKIRDDVKTKYAESGFSVRDRNDPAPMIRRAISQMTGFLTFVGLTALIVGGVGIANGVTTYLERKRKTLAVFKCLGASSALIGRIYFFQVMIVASLGIAIGLLVGAGLPVIAQQVFSDLLPFELVAVTPPAIFAVATTYGILVSVLFILWPLGRAQRIKPLALIRETLDNQRQRPPRKFIWAAGLVAAALIAITILTADRTMFAVYFCAGLTLLFAAFFALGHVLQKGFGLLPRPRVPEVALAITNLGAPGALTRSVTLSLGTGLSLLIAVALIDRSMVTELQTGLPKNAPNYFFLDIGKHQTQDFENYVKNATPDGVLNQAPMLRGRIVSLAGKASDTIKAPPNAAWVLRGDRGLTYAAKPPEGSNITKGDWWPENYEGEPLVSFEEEIAEGLGLKIGDEVVVNVLGRNVSARIANFRTLKWESLSINFVMIFSPNTLRGAPFNNLATLRTQDDPEESSNTSFVQNLTEKFPNITVIRVKDTIEAVNEIFSKLMLGIRAAGALTLLAGSLVLAGALATAHRSRIYQAVILKTLGATRRRIIVSHLLEYLFLAIATALLSTILGSAVAWVTVTQLMDLSFSLSIRAILEALIVATFLVVILGTAGSWRALSAKASPQLRANS